MTIAEFHQKVGVPFPNPVLSKIKATFDMENIELVQSLLALDPSEILTTVDNGFVVYGSEKNQNFDFILW